jgi:hypothetical protein
MDIACGGTIGGVFSAKDRHAVVTGGTTMMRAAGAKLDVMQDCVGSADVFLYVVEALVAGTTFSEFVHNTRFLGRKRQWALELWLRRQPVGKPLSRFEGSAEELQVVSDHIAGTSRVVCRRSVLTAGSVCGAKRVDLLLCGCRA